MWRTEPMSGTVPAARPHTNRAWVIVDAPRPAVSTPSAASAATASALMKSPQTLCVGADSRS